IIIILLCFPLLLSAQNVTIKVVNQPAPVVFRSIIEQTGKNFVYSSDLLKDMKITVSANKQPLKKVLSEIFKDTDIEYKIKGNNVVLKKRKVKQKSDKRTQPPRPTITTAVTPVDTVKILEEIVVMSRLESPVVTTAEIGARKITAEEVSNIPTLLGEPDVIKAMQLQPGVSAGTEGLSGMHVHGGNSDENLISLDNVPLYQVNHFAGLISAFNPDIIRYIDFFKTSIPAKYDGRLSSFMDVRLQNGSLDGHHGTARIGLTSGAFNISGPIGKKTTYLVGVRCPWYTLVTIPILAIINSDQEEKTRANYNFLDVNAKVNHRFSSKMTGFFSVYYGNDLLKTGYEGTYSYSSFDGPTATSYEKERFDFNWGNFVAQVGLNYRIHNNLTAEFNTAYTRYFANMRHRDTYKDYEDDSEYTTKTNDQSDNNINDWIFRGDFDWIHSDASHIRFGANYVRHSFLPEHTKREYLINDEIMLSKDSVSTYRANEFNAYIEDDWSISERLRTNIGLHTSLFYIDGKTHGGISPRFSLSYRINDNLSVKGAYSRTVQYVHQLTTSYLSLPTDQWIPITGKFKPQTADKVAIGGYWQSNNGVYGISLEAYYKKMHNLVEYRDEYYLHPPLELWDTRLTSGKGSAKGIDFMVEKTAGKFTGRISYSLAWADRQFKEKNGGHPYPARFDNRHTINVVVNWNVSKKVTFNATWIGHSGNLFTLLPPMWEEPDFGLPTYTSDAPLKAHINNY
ncbi:MAG: TonB-dependent receptor, partial [Muribaculaceae bacterium]|nr:TonB-dependent receptor [Muribaculaceae bacterium]